MVSVQNRYVRLTMKDGKTIWGKLLNVDTFAYQIFDSSEKRLARILLLLANFGKEGRPEPIVPRISQETAAALTA